MHDSIPTLFVVAGYPASGKTTALKLSATSGLKLFPEELQPRFRDAVRAANFRENDPASEKLRNGMWLTASDCADLNDTKELPRHMAFHLDLLLWIILSAKPATSADLDEEKILNAFHDFFDQPWTENFSDTVVSTVHTDFRHVEERWGVRRKKDQIPDNYTMSVKDFFLARWDARDAFYEMIIQLWRQVAAERAGHSFVTRIPQLPLRKVAEIR